MRCRAPALGPSLVLLGAVAAARELGASGLGWATIALVGAGLLSRRRYALALAAAIGWSAGALEPASDEALRDFAPDRPVEVKARLVGVWRRADGGWSGRLRVESLHQGERVVARTPPLTTFVPGGRPAAGSRVVLRGYLRAPAPPRNGAPPRRGRWRLALPSGRLLETEPTAADRLWGWSRDARRRIDERLRRREADDSALAAALLLGDTSMLPASRLAALRRLGLGHLVAVSGLHLGLLAVVVWILAGPLAFRWRLAMVAVFLGTFVAVVGPRPALVRAALMALVVLVSLALERRPEGLNSWALAVAVMVAADPSLLDEVAFQLTAAATLGLLGMTPALRELLDLGFRRPSNGPEIGGGAGAPRSPPRRPAWISALAASLAAHVATLPWAVAVFHLWSPASILLNLLAVPWTALILPVAVVAVLVEPWAGLGDAAWWLFGALAAPYAWLAALPPGPPWSFVVLRPFGVTAALSLVLGVAVARRRARAAAAATAVTCLFLTPLGARSTWSSLRSAADVAAVDSAELVVLDVGQGEAILLRDGRHAALVDGGGWRSPGVAQRVVLPALLRLGVRRLDGVVLTHPDRDHCGGLLELTLLVPVPRLWSLPSWREGCYRDLLRSPRTALSPIWAGRRFRVGRWRVEVLHPPPAARPRGNDASLVLLASWRDWRLLLTGDVGEAAERALVTGFGGRLAAPILKVGHHGSRGSSTAELLERVSPRLALVSAGRRNVYGHPAPEALARLRASGASVWRTDLGGQVRIRLRPDALIVDHPWWDATAGPVTYNAPERPPWGE